MESVEKCGNKRIKRFFCRHEYKYKEQMLISAGMQKMIVYKCEKCGKEKRKII